MNFEPIIWGTLTSAVPSLVIFFTIVFIFDNIRSLFSNSK